MIPFPPTVRCSRRRRSPMRGNRYARGHVALVAILVVASAPLALAQAPQPTATQATGTTVATLTLHATTDLMPMLELALPIDSLAFDLRLMPSEDGAPTCVVGTRDDTIIASDAVGQPLVAPGGTDFRVDAWPGVRVVGGDALPSYPPPPDVGTVVCYRTFVLRAYANEPGWSLAASRFEQPGFEPIRAAYIGAACEGDVGGGMVALDDGVLATLAAPSTLTRCRQVLVVVAVKVGPDVAGTTASVVRYTMMAPDADFASE